jgi:hypothetical protein
MTIEDIEPKAGLLRAENADVLTVAKYSNADLESLYLETSRNELYIDLLTAAGYTPEDVNIFSDLLTQNTSLIETALSYLQLMKYYEQQGGSDDSKMYKRYAKYKSKYNDCKVLFSRMKSGVYANIQNIQAWL